MKSLVLYNTAVETDQKCKLLRYSIIYYHDDHLISKMNKFQCDYTIIVIIVSEKESQNGHKLKFYKLMAIPTLLYGYQAWAMRKK